MIAVTSLLDAEHSERVLDLIHQLEQRFGICAVKTTPYPHITFLTAEVAKLSDLKQYLEDFSRNFHTITVRSTGLGIFPGEKPIIYIPILRTPPLNALHDRLYSDVSQFSQDMGLYYNSELWLPHVTLALHDTNQEMLGPILSYLSRFNFNWQISLDNLAILKKSGDKFLKEDIYSLRNETTSVLT